MPPFCPEAIDAARRRLRGQLVAVPLIGGVRLLRFGPRADLRLLPEVLQPGGSLAYRGAIHQLVRQLGSLRGAALVGPPAWLPSLALAAATQRLPMLALPSAPLPAGVAAELRRLGCEPGDPVAGSDATAIARRHGFTVVGDPHHEDFALGVASLGRELAELLPLSTATLWVPAPFAAAIAAGLSAGRTQVPDVIEVAPGNVPEGLGEALLRGHHLAVGEAGLSVLAAALAAPAGTTVAAVLAD